jgi:ferredoxin-NADP reductase
LKSKITLFYGCRTEKDLAFRRELEELANKNKNLNLVLIVTEPTAQWKGATGIINAEKVKQYLPDYKENVFFTCGPPPMVEAMEKLVLNLGLPKEKLKREYFTGYQ